MKLPMMTPAQLISMRRQVGVWDRDVHPRRVRRGRSCHRGYENTRSGRRRPYRPCRTAGVWVIFARRATASSVPDSLPDGGVDDLLRHDRELTAAASRSVAD